MTSPAGTSKTTAKKKLAWDDVAKQVGLQTGMYSNSEYSFICLRWLTTVLMEYKSTTLNSFEKGSKAVFSLHYLMLA